MYFRHVAGLAELTAAHVRLAGPQAETPLKADRVVTGMLMGAGSIDDMNLLRACGLHHSSVDGGCGGNHRPVTRAQPVTGRNHGLRRSCWSGRAMSPVRNHPSGQKTSAVR